MNTTSTTVLRTTCQPSTLLMPQHSSTDSSNSAFNNSFKEGSDHNPSVAGRHSQLILNGNQIINIPVDSSTNKIIITQECVKINKKGK